MKDKDLLKISASQWGDFKVLGTSIKYNQIVPTDKTVLTSTSSSVPARNRPGSYITIINPIPGHKVYAKIKTDNYKLRLCWYKSSIGEAYDVATGQSLGVSTSFLLPNEGVYTITDDMIYTDGYLQLYYYTFAGLETGEHNNEVQIIDLTAIGLDNVADLAEFKQTELYKYLQNNNLPFGSGIVSATSPFDFYKDDEKTTLSRTNKINLGSSAWRELNRSSFPQFAGIFYATINDKSVEADKIRNLLCSKYPLKTISGGWANMEDKTLNVYFQSNKDIAIKDTSFANPTDFKNSLAGVYLEYEPAEPLVLRGLYNASSLLGKQNIESTTSSNTNRYFRCLHSNEFEIGSGIYNSTSYYKGSAISNEDYLLLVIKTNIDSSNFGNAYFTQGTAVNFRNDTLLKIGNFLITKQRLNTSSTETDSYHFRITQPTVVPYKVEYAILVNLTALGLDNLTAQQFYDQFNDKFDLLANGQSVSLLADEYQNRTGKVVRRIGVDDDGNLVPLSVPVIEQHASIMLSKAITKVEDSGKIELEIIRR